MGLSVSYRENADNRNWFRMLLAMQYVDERIVSHRNAD